MAFLIVLSIIAMFIGMILWVNAGFSLIFFLALGFFILFLTCTHTRLFAFTLFLLGVVAGIYLLITHNFTVYMILIGVAGFLKACKFLAMQGEDLEVSGEFVFEEKLYRWIDEDLTFAVRMFFIVPCVAFYLGLGCCALIVEFLGFIPALFLLYRFIRVVQCTRD